MVRIEFACLIAVRLGVIVAICCFEFGTISVASEPPECLYIDDDINCQGFTPEQYQQRIREHQNSQRGMYQQYQLAMADQVATEQRVFERVRLGRRARFEKEARQREELIARRRAAGLSKSSKPPVATKSGDKSPKSSK